ncbi:MAG: AMP-binding protein [Oscillospiraceae bacterium]|nr:AMP-binding protein [Oscillospiraceae bacterium]
MNPITPAGQLAEAAAARPEQFACTYMGREFTYAELFKMSEECARSFAAIGVHENCRVMLHMPLIPQALSCFYGLNMLGAAAVIPADLPPADCISQAGVRAIVTIEGFYDDLDDVPQLPTTIFARPQDTMGKLKKLEYILTEARNVDKVSEGFGLLSWDGFLLGGKALRGEHRCEEHIERTAALICHAEPQILSNRAFIFAEPDLPIIAFHQAIINGSCPELDI